MAKTPQKELCPCGSGKAYAQCCGPYHAGVCEPATAEALMRSRYSAFVLQKRDWLMQTWAPEQRPAELTLDSTVRWLGLRIKSHCVIDDNHATVHFVARARGAQGRAWRQEEISRFERRQGRWLYVDGDILEQDR